MTNINLLSDQTLNLLQEYIKRSQHPIICCHKSPDGDALGSSIGWAEYLKSQNKEVQIIIPDAYPDFLQFMTSSQSIIRYDKLPDTAKRHFQQSDLIFCLDFNDEKRVDEMHDLLAQSQAPKILIDHHLNPVILADISISYPQLCSTSEIVFRVIHQLNGYTDMTLQAAIAIYTGMMTDTMGFIHNSSYPEIYQIISLLLAKGIDKDKIYRNVYNNYSAWAIRFRGYLMSQKLNVINGLKASYFCVERQDMKRFNFIKGDLEGLVNEPLKIKGQKLSISLRENKDKENIIYVSLRSVDDFPCNEMATKHFNGGGHLNASGGKLFCSLQEAEQITIRAIQDYAERLK